ncbi:transcriptional regulator with XRE-family HTH domain [Neorhizobium galegae]|uniref:helix-turn-helix domain-containing protein n=1 Tax=Neorhizobium galegae TaxID=399 RepID=UPI001AE47941|nr:XRE family transcriptional regulator [Neorhizobium galegae]MBP2562528.1 transcriptional regulator with XRE-family HTH domain [Neorhizobium galegae]
MNIGSSDESSEGEGSFLPGTVIKAQRVARGWTLDELSKRSGVSIAAISKIEKGQSNPSFESTLKIARSLQMNFVNMMEGAKPSGSGITARLTSTKSGQVETYRTSRYDYNVHSTGLTHKVMVPLQMTIHNREAPPIAEWSIHDGEEFIFVLKGTLQFFTEHYAPLTLQAGESCYLDSTMRHAFAAVGEGDTEILSVCLSVRPFESLEP